MTGYVLFEDMAQNERNMTDLISMLIKIYNATRGGKLDAYERADFDYLFLALFPMRIPYRIHLS